MEGIITVIASALIAGIGIWQSNTAKKEDRTFFGLTPLGLLLMVLAIICGVAGLISAIKDYNVKSNPIVVSPVKYTLCLCSSYDNTTTFEVHNRSDNTIYTTWVKILIEKNNLKGTILIDIISADGRKFIKPKRDVEPNAEVLSMHVLDKDNQPTIFLVFRSLISNETRQFQLKAKSLDNIEPSQNMTIRYSVSGYKHEPYWFGTNKNEFAFKLEVPEGYTMQKKLTPFEMLEKK